jgi:hypothetical protein
MNTQIAAHPSQRRKNTSLLPGKHAKGLRIPKRSLTALTRIGRLCVECMPLEIISSNLGPGLTAFFPMPLKQRPIFYSDQIYVYADSRLPNSPTRREIGFTEEEVIDTLGVTYFLRNRDCEYGESFPLEWLLCQLDDLSLRQRILHRAVEMRDLIHLDDEFIDEKNALIASRDFVTDSLH